MEIASVAVIVVICYLIGMGVKAVDQIPDKWIPVIVGICGGIIGALALYFSPDLIPAHDIFTAVAIGIVSGLSATGVNQIGKQSGKEE